MSGQPFLHLSQAERGAPDLGFISSHCNKALCVPFTSLMSGNGAALSLSVRSIPSGSLKVDTV